MSRMLRGLVLCSLVLVPLTIGAQSRSRDSAEADRLMRQGDTAMDDGNYDRAVDRYERALELLPNTPEFQEKLAAAYLYNRQLSDADKLVNRLTSRDQRVSFRVLHNHFLGFCEGLLIIERRGISFEPVSGTHAFFADNRSIESFVESHLGPDLPSLLLKARERNEDKRYDFLMPAYLRIVRRDAADLEHMYTGSDRALSDTSRANRIILKSFRDR